MKIEAKTTTVLEAAATLAAKTKSWIDFSNQVFSPRGGLIAKAFPSDADSEAFRKTAEYNQIHELMLGLMKKYGVANGVATKSGKFIVRVPKTLHSSLEIEADREGVSLNQLALAKLALPLQQSTQLSPSLIIRAFSEIHDGYAADRIICDPVFNSRFLRRCRALGLDQSDFVLNHSLYDIRKSPKKGRLPATTKKTEFRDYDLYEFASEISVRFLQRNDGAALDSILCDPILQSKFDAIADRLVPKTPVLKLRYAALNLRKTHRLQPRDMTGTDYDLVSVGPVERVNLEKLPDFPAVYLFQAGGRPIFAGETDKFRNRISKHLEVSDRRGLPQWLNSDGNCQLRYAALPSVSRDERLRWLRQFINKEKPLLNYQKVA